MPSLVLDGRRGIQTQVLAVPGADHLHRLRKTVPDADGERHGRQPEGVDGHGHPHGPQIPGYPTIVEIGPRQAGDVRGDRGDDQRVRLLELTPRPQQ